MRRARRASIFFAFFIASCLRCASVSCDESGTKIVETGTSRGRATVATRRFEVGEIFMREAPVLVWDGSDLDFLNQYLSVSDEVQSEIENLAHLPLNSPTKRVMVLREQAARLVDIVSSQTENLSVNQIHKLLLIANTNLHHFFGHAPERADVASEYLHADQVALFPKAAKVNHACSPNAMYTTQTVDGKIQYTAIREINEGDEITFSYLGEEGETLSRDRRAQLLAERDIKCECSRCVSPDWWRGLRCPKPGCRGLAFPTWDPKQQRDQWKCLQCGDVSSSDMTERLMHEASVGNEIELFTSQCHRFDEQPPDPQHLIKIVKDAQLGLAATHSLLCQAQQLLSKVYASYAHRLGQNKPVPNKPSSVGTAADCRLHSAQADIRALLLSEQITAGQHSCEWDTARSRYITADGDGDGDVDSEGPAPLFEFSRMAFDAGQSLLKVAEPQRTPALLKHVGRYLPMMWLRYGAGDPDVNDIAMAVEGACRHP